MVVSINNVVMSYYVYVYLDPRHPGKYSYEGLECSFLFKPFYIGKGKGTRYKRHLTLSKSERKFNTHKTGIIDAIQSSGFDMQNYILILRNYDSEDDAFHNELQFIKCIGRSDLKLGPLTNQTDGGKGSFDKGTRNIAVRNKHLRKKVVMSEEQKAKLSALRSLEIKQIDKTTYQVISVWKNAQTAAKTLGICVGAIHSTVSETQPAKTAGGFMWEYVSKPNKKYINGLTYVDKSGHLSPNSRTIKAYNIYTDETVLVIGITKFCKQHNLVLRRFRDSIKTKLPQNGWLLLSYEN